MKWVLALMLQVEQLQSHATTLEGATTFHLTLLQWQPPVCTTFSASISEFWTADNYEWNVGFYSHRLVKEDWDRYQNFKLSREQVGIISIKRPSDTNSVIIRLWVCDKYSFMLLTNYIFCFQRKRERKRVGDFENQKWGIRWGSHQLNMDFYCWAE